MKEGKKHILVVDDEESIRRNLKAFLEDEGFAVTVVRTGEEGLEMLSRSPIDGAIVDMRLPGMDGNRFIETAHETQPDVAFVIYTGSVDYKLPASLLQLDIEEGHVFRKPYDEMSVLSATLHDLLQFKTGG